MKMKRKLMLFAVLVLAVGYAAITATLNIGGSSTVGTNQDEFDVYFSNAKENGVENKKLIQDDIHLSFKTAMMSIGEKYTLEYDVTNGSRNYDADIIISCTESNEYLKVTNMFDTTTALPATETRTGTLTIEVIKSYIGTGSTTTKDMEISCEINGSAVERNSKAEGTPAEKAKQKWTLATDSDKDGNLSIGDLITYGSESFYITSINGDNVKALAQYNLMVGNSYNGTNTTPLENPSGLQNPLAIGRTPDNSFPRIGTIAYDSTYKTNDYSKSTIKPYADTYAEKLNEFECHIDSIGLITQEELEALGCVVNGSYSSTCKDSPYPWVHSTSYWTGIPNNTTGEYYITPGGIFSAYDLSGVSRNDSYGLRPVITISKSLFEE